jgi:haloalkane dehalogenase
VAGGDGVVTPARPAWLPVSIFPFESRFQDVDGCRIHYVDEGTGPTLLLLHGNPTYSFLYRHLIATLKGRFSVHRPGLPRLRPFNRQSGLRIHARRALTHRRSLHPSTRPARPDADGSGLGRPIGLGFAGRAPERIRALVIGNTWAWPVNGDKRFERFSALAVASSAACSFAVSTPS